MQFAIICLNGWNDEVIFNNHSQLQIEEMLSKLNSMDLLLRISSKLHLKKKTTILSVAVQTPGTQSLNSISLGNAN